MTRSSFRNGWILGACLVVAGITAQAQDPSAATPPPATPAPTAQAPMSPASAVPGPPTASMTAEAKAQGIQITQGGTIQGTVVAGTAGKPGAVPLPGVSVTATNTLTGKKYTGATDIDGNYKLSIARNGRYVVRAELVGFASATSEVVLSGDLSVEAAKSTTFGMELASRAEAAEAKQEAAKAATSATSLTHGVQNLSLSGNDNDTEDASTSAGNTGVAMPSLSSMNDGGGSDLSSSGSDSITVSGQDAQMNGLANYSEDEIHEHIQDAMERARSEGRLPQGASTDGVTDAIVGVMGGMMSSAGPSMGGDGGRHSFGGGGSKSGGGGGGGSSHGGSSHGSGAFRGFNPSQPHGSAYYQGDYSDLDSGPWSPTLTPEANPAYVKNTFGASFAGSPYIPGLMQPSSKHFIFVSFSGKRDTTPDLLTGVVPTDAERLGNFAGQRTIYNPVTGLPFTGNQIDPTLISQQALNILNQFYPACNINCNAVGNSRYNYQTITTAGQNSSSLSARYVRNIGQNASNPFSRYTHSSGPAQLRQNVNANFSYSHSASDQRKIFLALGGATLSNGFNFGLGYTVSYGHLANTTSVSWNRSHAMTRNYFTDTSNDPSTDVGINRPSNSNPGFRANFYNGLPSIQMNEFASISNTAPSETISQTISLSDSVSWRLHHHSMHFGFDFRRVHQDSLGGSNPLGSIVFSGFNTESQCDQDLTAGVTPAPTCPTNSTVQSGNSFADFLLGLPQQSKIEASVNKIYLRENVLSAYAMDDFHVSANVTVNYGLRYEYFAPYTEKNGHLINLTGVASQTTSVGCVTPNGLNQNGINCAPGPTSSLLHPDRTMLSPRFGIAWVPKILKHTVIRGGYGLNFNTSQYASFAKLLSYQPPFASVQNNVLQTAANTTGCTTTNLTLPNPYGCSNKPFQNSFGVNPNYRLGMVQVYNLDIQRTIPWGVVLNIGYNGSHGSNLDVIRAPNQNFNTVTTTNAVAFTYEDSTGESTFNALTLNAQKRLQHGLALSALYQYAHSIDDASTIGGAGSTSSIQDDTNLHAERSNSSFDVRHKVTLSTVYEPPFGPNRAFLDKGGFWAGVLDNFIISANATITSGTYFTPAFANSAAQIAAGGTYTLRPDRDFTQPISGAGSLHSYFNTVAFFCNQANTGSSTCQPQTHYGSASRYSIQGPGQLSVNASLSRSVPLGDTRNLELRMTASNVFNTVQYNNIDTTVNSASFGQVTSAAAMRRIVFQARYRF